MTKQELEYKIVSVKRSIEVKSQEVVSDKKYLKSLEKQLQELTRGDQRDMFEGLSGEDRNTAKALTFGDRYGSSKKLGEEDWGFGNPKDETSMEHDLRVNEIDVMWGLGG